MSNIANPNDFSDVVQIRVNRLLQTITNLDREQIVNVKGNRGAFPKKYERVVDPITNRKTVVEQPYTPADIFAVYLISDADGGLETYERIGNTVDGLYKFQVEVVFYGASSPFISTQFILNSSSEIVRLWMQYAEMSFSEYPKEMETLDTMINNEWWIIRKITLKLNVGLKMEFPRGDFIEDFEHSTISLGGIEL